MPVRDERLNVLNLYVQDAGRALEAPLPPYEGRSMRWTKSDFSSFGAAMNLEAYVVEYGLETVPQENRLAVAESLCDWRKALPFTDAERARLLEVKREHPIQPKLASIVRQEIGYEFIIDAGIEQPTSGKHLMRSWWKWRRGIDRFNSQNGPERAMRALWLAGHALREDAPGG